MRAFKAKRDKDCWSDLLGAGRVDGKRKTVVGPRCFAGRENGKRLFVVAPPCLAVLQVTNFANLPGFISAILREIFVCRKSRYLPIKVLPHLVFLNNSFQIKNLIVCSHSSQDRISATFRCIFCAILSVGTSFSSPPKGSSISSAINSRLAST